MNIEKTNIKTTTEIQTNTSNNVPNNNEASSKFSEELNELKNKENLNEHQSKIHQVDEKRGDKIKNLYNKTDNDGKDITMINNDFSIQENKEILPQMNPNMNFSGDGQPFSSFMNNQEKNNQDHLISSVKELAEEAAILSTMAENIAIANRNNSIIKTNKETGITEEVIVKYDNIILNKADVEIFNELVNQKEINLNNISSESIEKSVKISKTLADMLVKCKENNQPLRIDFDNNISVIIRISREGKLSAEFLPSTQIAEAYLKENLPLLKQRFDDNNIEYENLSHRERKQQREGNKKKGHENE